MEEKNVMMKEKIRLEEIRKNCGSVIKKGNKK